MAAPKFTDWVRQLGDSTYGIQVKGLSPADQKKVYASFAKHYADHPDLVEASANAVADYQGSQVRTAAVKKAATAPPANPSAPTKAPAADVASQAAQNPTATALTQGQFSAQSQVSSLFGSGGIDPTTPIPGIVPGGPVGSTGETLSGRGSFSNAISQESGSYNPETTQTADQWLSGLYKMDPQDLAKLQQKLYATGWYDPSNVPNAQAVPYGKVDPATIAAYESAMIETSRYNQAGKHLLLDDVISQGAPRVPGAGTKVKQPSQQFANPIDLKNQVQQSAESLTGQDLSAQQAEQFSQFYQAQEKASYAQYAQAGQDRAAGLGGAYTGPPSAQASAEAYIRQTDPTQVQAYGMASRAQEFLQLLGSATGL